MDRIPLISPNLIKVSAAVERAPVSVLRAEVISSTPAQHDPRPQEYKVVLKIGQQEIETISNNDLKKGSLLEVKVLPGPELKIINTTPQTPLTATASQPNSLQTSSLQTNALVQQLLADRIPQLQQQDLPHLIKQLSQIISLPVNGSSSIPSNTPSSPLCADSEKPILSAIATKLTNQQSLANQLYLQQGKAPIAAAEASNTTNTTSDTAVQQVKAWLQQLPKELDISNTTGLRNALNSAGIQAENQLSHLAQKSLNLADKKSANSIFQQLQSLQKTAIKERPNSVNGPIDSAPKESIQGSGTNKTDQKSGLKIDLASIVKRTAKALSDNSQNVLASLVTSKAIPTAATPSSLTTLQWQNPLFNNTPLSLDDLLHAPLLQNPSSNNKFALSQILAGHALAGNSEQAEGGLRIPLNWPERSGNDAILMRNLQNLLGHIEREQIQQMQSAEASQSNNPNQLQQSQQWVPLLINYQQQLQLIEFYLDKEERLNQAGEKKNHWFINLHFDLPKLGQLGIEIAMLDNECNTTFWSESSLALTQLSQHIQPLRQRLTEQGIIVSDIQSRHGTLEKRKHNIQQRLVDIKT
jgi:hypothetical protein